MEIDHKPGANRPGRCDVTAENRGLIDVNGTTARSRALCISTHNLLTFGGNEHGAKARNMGTTCLKEGAAHEDL
ncbi:hypothetical protein TNIN_213991 [Trichonephila inaurata madagascariensis]|uniref:Uncharacterized protein n=1 Tax=Trichonephila inaurata madagascariensis TaxID=2747483 RepID=A0A8X7C5J6_9ARAC|nr:hypothetical protein TNIN_213991 [Trichonephila inaurata madagascariensis]